MFSLKKFACTANKLIWRKKKVCLFIKSSMAYINKLSFLFFSLMNGNIFSPDKTKNKFHWFGIRLLMLFIYSHTVVLRKMREKQNDQKIMTGWLVEPPHVLLLFWWQISRLWVSLVTAFPWLCQLCLAFGFVMSQMNVDAQLIFIVIQIILFIEFHFFCLLLLILG